MLRGLVLCIAVLLAGCMMWKPGKIVRHKPPTMRPAPPAETRADPAIATQIAEER
jgi:hypothetical protein